MTERYVINKREAIFDGYDDTRGKLVNFADSLLDYKIENPDAVFNLSSAQDLWNKS